MVFRDSFLYSIYPMVTRNNKVRNPIISNPNFDLYIFIVFSFYVWSNAPQRVGYGFVADKSAGFVRRRPNIVKWEEFSAENSEAMNYSWCCKQFFILPQFQLHKFHFYFLDIFFS